MQHDRNIEYHWVNGPGLLGQVRRLFLEYADSLTIDLAFQDFAAEVETLPGKYAPPQGRLLLASVGGKTAGCAALRQLTDDTGELKRLYVRNSYHGLGAGTRLVGLIIEAAKNIGYRNLCLDTLPNQKHAQAIYESYGFSDIDPYVFNPVEGTRYMGLKLSEV